MLQQLVNADLLPDRLLQVGPVLQSHLLHGARLPGVAINEKFDFGKSALTQDLHQIPAFDKFANHGAVVVVPVDDVVDVVVAFCRLERRLEDVAIDVANSGPDLFSVAELFLGRCRLPTTTTTTTTTSTSTTTPRTRQ